MIRHCAVRNTAHYLDHVKPSMIVTATAMIVTSSLSASSTGWQFCSDYTCRI